MKVTVLEETLLPEKLICQTARGDYYAGFVGDDDYTEIMGPVTYDEDYANERISYHREELSRVFEEDMYSESDFEEMGILEAKERSLIKKLIRSGHYGPFEHPSITFAVEGISRVTMAQITRHRHLSFDVQSMRYVDFTDDADVVVPKSLTDENHFSRDEGVVDISREKQQELEEMYRNRVNGAIEDYEEMVEAGIPKEDARFALPLGTKVNLTMSGNARTMLHIINMRKKPDAQWEVRELSNKLYEELEKWIPRTVEMYEKHGSGRLSP